MNTIINLNSNYSQEVESDRKTTSEISNSVLATPSYTSSEAGSRHLPYTVSLSAAHSLDDRLAFESELFQFVLSESEATFMGHTHLFFNPGGQKLQYNQN